MICFTHLLELSWMFMNSDHCSDISQVCSWTFIILFQSSSWTIINIHALWPLQWSYQACSWKPHCSWMFLNLVFMNKIQDFMMSNFNFMGSSWIVHEVIQEYNSWTILQSSWIILDALAGVILTAEFSFTWLDSPILTADFSVHPIWTHQMWLLTLQMGLTAGVTGRRGMLAPPWHLILLSHLSGVRVALHSIL
jgi:hypothetical protein